MSEYVIEMLNITKRFPGIVGNDNITLQLKKGEIHALLGENGAGKSTLMSVLFGLYQPEEGEIRKDGKKVDIPSFQVKPGQVIEIRERAKNLSVINEALEAATATVDFVEVNKDAKKGTYVRYPERKELFTAQEINELLVVEFYNR